MSSHDHDLAFLSHVHGILDESPRADVTGQDVGRALGLDDDTAEAVQARLIRKNLLEKRHAPARLGDGPLDARLNTTPAGADAADRQDIA